MADRFQVIIEALEADMPLRWTEKLAVGDELIDEQHKSIFRCLEHLEKAVAENRGMYAVYTITVLSHYVRDHFSAEEALMRFHDYPDIDSHIAEHKKFKEKVKQLSRKSIFEDVSTEMITYMREWLTHHIGRLDLQYAPYLTHRISELIDRFPGECDGLNEATSRTKSL